MTRSNVFQLLGNFIDEFTKLKAYEFPLWTAVAIPYIAEHALTTFVEGHFNIVKHHVLKNHLLPLRLDKLLKLILNYYLGNAAVLTSHLKAFNQNDGPFPSPPSKGNKFTINLSSKDINTGQSIKKQQCDFIQAESKNTDDNEENINVRNVEENNNINKIPTKKDELKYCVIINGDSRKKANKADVRADVNSVNSIPGKLSDFPIDINLGSHQYRLSGVIVLEPGHFIPYCRRINNRWDKCNDLNTKVISVRSHTLVLPLVYIDASFDFIEDSCFTENETSGNIESDISLNCQFIELLKPGNATPEITVNKTIIQLNDTHNFDCIVHIIACAALDNSSYLDFVRNSSNETLQFVNDFISLKLCNEIYIKRALLLKSLYSSKICTKTCDNVSTYVIDLCESISCTWTTCLKNQASIFNAYTCDFCGYSSYFSLLLKVDAKIITKNVIKALSEAIAYYKYLKKVKCRHGNCSKFCNITAYPNNHLFIDLNIDECDENFKCNLQDFPIVLHLEKEVNKYQTTGVIARDIDHEVAYCFRADKTWELYDNYSSRMKLFEKIHKKN
ncbi:uncharacterized protein LOC123269605 [Cotesia glomerata]|uniref:uncharacterized protein LOC123269605 n=1 Tax=Cotesia glomerata TaxID=32391 RepID=UPI001D024686|nr:uncharacterized protein LOC123269605 [Cotesia glomerata]